MTTPRLDLYQVAYVIDMEATDMAHAAEQLAELLTDPAVPLRGAYRVRNLRTNDSDIIDLGEDEF